MDFSRIRHKLQHLQYSSTEEFKYDLNLIWRNAKDFNPVGSFIVKLANRLQVMIQHLRFHYGIYILIPKRVTWLV
jgi:hypothetical protein